MGKKLEKIILSLAVLGLPAACAKQKNQGGDEVKYDFAGYELAGGWTEYGTGSSRTLFFAGDTVLWKDDAGKEAEFPFAVEENGSVRRRQITFSGEEAPFDSLLFRMIDVNGWSVDCLFAMPEDDATAALLFVKDSDLFLLPDGYIPMPDDGEREEEIVPEEKVDEEQLTEEFQIILAGEWTEIQSEAPWRAVFDEKTVTWLLPDGSQETVDYSLDRYPSSNRIRYIQPMSIRGSYGFSSLIARKKIIGGEPLYVLFAVDEPTGTTRIDITRIFVKNGDLARIPGGYTVDYDTDNETVYRRPDLKETLFVPDVLDTMEWLGKTPAETGVEDRYIDHGNVVFNGYLFGKKVNGKAYSIDAIDSISMYSYALDYDDCVKQFTSMYGEGEAFDIPYVAGEGATTGMQFSAEDRYITVSMSSEQLFLSITVSLRS